MQEFTKQSALSDIFLPNIQNGDERNSIALKLWVGATIAAKGTRATFNFSGGEQPYTLQERILHFKHADNLARNDEMIRTGIEVAPIVELFVRPHNVISLDGSDANSPIRKHIKTGVMLQYITSGIRI